jgi:DnaJ-class molecular chaperone
MSEIHKSIQRALEVLNLPPFVSINEIRDRYIALTKIHHSDVNEKDSKMREINEAYEILKSYAKNFRFTFSSEEIDKQFPESIHARKFKF